MKKKFLTLLGGALLGLFSMSATALTDVTGTYLVNPSFETGDVGAITSLDGWTLPSLGTSFVNISLGSLTECDGQAFGIPSPNDGEKYYFNRRGWNSSTSSEGTLSTTTETELPAGKYTISFAYKVLDNYDDSHNSKGSTLTIKAIASDIVLGQETITFSAVKGNAAGSGKFANDDWQTLSVEFNVISSCQVTFSIVEKLLGGVRSDVVIDNVKLYYDNTVDKSNLEALINSADALFDEDANGAEDFEAAINSAKDVLNNDDATVAQVLAAESDLQKAISNYNWANASPENPVDVTSKIVNPDCSSTTGWSLSTCASNSGQHWDGTTTNTYLEPCNWNANSWTASAKQTISLPNGHYKLVAAGRASEGVTLNLVANSQKVAFGTYGDVGGTIATDGTEWDSVQDGIDAGKSFANNNNGRGWTYKSIDDIIIIDQNLALGAESSSSTLHSWCSIDDFKLFYQGPITEDDKIPAAKDQLKSALDGAKAAPTVNIGTGAFQYSETAVNAYTAVLTTAQAVYENTASTLAQIEEATASVKDAEFPTLNGPAADTRYTITLKYTGWTYDGKAVTYIAGGRSDMGEYNIQYLAEPAAYYAQAFMFTAVEGDKYKISQIDAKGVERYVSTGSAYSGGNATQIRTTTDVDKALVVEVRATDTEGKWNLWNTEANQYIGSQDAGVFTVNSHIDFALAEAPKATAILSVTDVHWGTFIAPFDVTIPEGVEAYTCTGVEGTSITMVEVETKIPANTPVMVYSENAYYNTFSDYGHATKSIYEGKLTGVYTDTQAPADSYVLMANNGSAVFGKVVENDEPTVGANRCYLSVPSSSTMLRFGDVTGIQSMEQQGEAVIYDLTGRRVDAAVKGIYIVGGKKMLVK